MPSIPLRFPFADLSSGCVARFSPSISRLGCAPQYDAAEMRAEDAQKALLLVVPTRRFAGL